MDAPNPKSANLDIIAASPLPFVLLNEEYPGAICFLELFFGTGENPGGADDLFLFVKEEGGGLTLFLRSPKPGGGCCVAAGGGFQSELVDAVDAPMSIPSKLAKPEISVDLSMSGMLEIEKKTRFGAKKWKSYWVVLEENTGTLSWFKSKRMSDKCLGSIELPAIPKACPSSCAAVPKCLPYVCIHRRASFSGSVFELFPPSYWFLPCSMKAGQKFTTPIIGRAY